ncbi:MAG: hypothetical protein ACKVPX_17890, partial [Myxococcaceae bacterium]
MKRRLFQRAALAFLALSFGMGCEGRLYSASGPGTPTPSEGDSSPPPPPQQPPPPSTPPLPPSPPEPPRPPPPTECTSTIASGDDISSAINALPSGGVLCLRGGEYAQSVGGLSNSATSWSGRKLVRPYGD